MPRPLGSGKVRIPDSRTLRRAGQALGPNVSDDDSDAPPLCHDSRQHRHHAPARRVLDLPRDKSRRRRLPLARDIADLQHPHRRPRDREIAQLLKNTTTRSPTSTAPAPTSPPRSSPRPATSDGSATPARSRTHPLWLGENRHPPSPTWRGQPAAQRRALPHRDRPTTPPPQAKTYLARRAQAPPRRHPLGPPPRLGRPRTRHESLDIPG
jgi:hypothetical protein